MHTEGSDSQARVTPVVVIGAGGFGREVIDIVDEMSSAGAPVHVRGSVDDADLDASHLSDLGVNLVGDTSCLSAGDAYVIGIGNGSVRRAILDRLPSGCHPVAIQHPSATVGSLCRLDAGSILCAGVRLATHTTVRRHGNVHANATIGHDVMIEEFATVLPGAVVSGSVTIETEALVGAGATVLQGLTIGAHATVGAGAVVTENVPANATVVGVPARVIATP